MLKKVCDPALAALLPGALLRHELSEFQFFLSPEVSVVGKLQDLQRILELIHNGNRVEVLPSVLEDEGAVTGQGGAK